MPEQLLRSFMAHFSPEVVPITGASFAYAPSRPTLLRFELPIRLP